MIETMLEREDGIYRWADNTLNGIYDTVSRNCHCSHKQWETVVNIRSKGDVP
jgi:hypothetical protein